ncbi:psychimicin-like [Leguminivora glycinivorella]|uniref:psychimicin-like n=1 Tax=Leguminivora glycinivorella TaxID=1035111 RepID=UPI0020101362|nr:psychimicin-like [Leguminivora glycinivorella]
MFKAFKVTFLVVLVTVTMVTHTEATNRVVPEPPCDQVCVRSNPEKEACCRAHNHVTYAFCEKGKMYCY